MPFIGEYQFYERELKCTCGNTERFKEYHGTMSIVATWECTDCGSAVIPK